MKEARFLELLREERELLGRAAASLEKSLAKCARLDLSPPRSFEDEESLDALTSKFARCSDLLTQKVLKTLAFLLREDAPTFLDRMNFGEKLGAIPSARTMVAIRDLRNTIAHEYAVEDLRELYADTLKLAPELLASVRAVEVFVAKTLATGQPGRKD